VDPRERQPTPADPARQLGAHDAKTAELLRTLEDRGMAAPAGSTAEGVSSRMQLGRHAYEQGWVTR
jgi:DNA-binding IclR family transcriptional regulator